MYKNCFEHDITIMPARKQELDRSNTVNEEAPYTARCSNEHSKRAGGNSCNTSPQHGGAVLADDCVKQ